MNTETDLGGNKPLDESSPTRSLAGGSGSTEVPKVIGKYRVLRLLGRGGMGLVFEGRDESLDRSVAIKLITPELCLYPEIFDRFRTEARAAARLNHPNIINVYEFGGDAREPYLVMEYVEGADLSSLMKKRGAFPPEEVVAIIRQSSLALSKAAAANLVHRDIKPSNILLTKDGVVKIMDFGLSKLLDSSTSLTTSGAMMGTPDYMSPEQASGEKLDYRTDMYSLGCTMFALLAGRKPFQSESLPGMIHQHMKTALPIPQPWKKIYGGRLVSLIQKMTAKKREDRPYSWDDVIRELDTMMAMTVAGQSTMTIAPGPVGGNRRIGYMIGAGVLVLLLIGTIAVTRLGRGDRNAQQITKANSDLTPVNNVMEKNALSSPTEIVTATDDAMEERFVLPSPINPAAARDDRPVPPPSPNDVASDGRPFVDEPPPPLNEDGDPGERLRERDGMGMARGMSDEEIEGHMKARREAIAALQAGDFAKGRRLLIAEMAEGQRPAPRPVQAVYTGILHLLDQTDVIDQKINAQLKNPAATTSQKIEAVHNILAAQGPTKADDRQAWSMLLYLHLLRDPAASAIYEQQRTRRPGFGEDEKQKREAKAINFFYDVYTGFPPEFRQKKL